MRRAFDAAAAALGLLLLSPVLAVVAAAIKLDDGGPVFYGQYRLGRGLRRFRLWKFRTMVPNADRLGGAITINSDPRVTRAGAVLRRYKVDELPQLWNVLKGDLALVGPRPELEPYVRMYAAEYGELLRHRPGITDPASLAYRNESELLASADAEEIYARKVLPDKLRLSLEYARRRTFLSDLYLIFKTLFGVVLAPDPGSNQGSGCGRTPS